MTVALTVNGQVYNYPETGDLSWGPDATEWAQAITSGVLQKAGGLFQLLAETDFGTSYGLKSLYYKSRTSNVADAGQIRLARADVISFRNQANSANLDLGVNASNVLTFDGVALGNFVSVLDTGRIDLTLSAGVLSADIVSGSITNTYINASAAIAYSKLNLSGSIVNADINASAAIAYSKLNLSTSIVNADISASAAIAFSKLATLTSANILLGSAGNVATATAVTGDISISNTGVTAISSGVIVNADVSGSAAIDFSKLAALTSGNLLIGSAGNVATSTAMSGDATIIASGALTIANSAVTNAKMANMANVTFKGNISGGAAAPSDLTATQVTANLNNLVGDSGAGGTKGLAPAPAAGDAAAGKFLKADGTWTAPAGAGDVVGPASSINGQIARFSGTTGKLLTATPATISNSDVDAAAAIAYSKLNLATSIVNADINASAAIAFSKLASLTSGNIIVGSAGNVPTSVAMSSEASIIASGAVTLANSAVIGKVLTGYTSGAGTVASTDTILQGIQKLNGNDELMVSSQRINNLGIAFSVAASAATIAIKTAAGSDATATTPISIGFRNATSATGTFTTVNITGALSTVISSGSTLGQVSAIAAYIYVYLINNSGTAEIAYSRQLYDDGSVVSTNAEGGAGGADSNSTIYSTTARSGVPLRLVGRILNTQATAGTWASTATEISVVPFQRIQVGAKYNTNAGQTITNSSGVFNIVDFEDRVYDTQNAVTTGASWVYTVTQPGLYNIECCLEFTSSTWTALDGLRLAVSTDGGTSAAATLAVNVVQTGTYSQGIWGSTTMNCATGSTLTIVLLAVRTGGSTTLRTTANRNEVEITRIGDEKGM